MQFRSIRLKVSVFSSIALGIILLIYSSILYFSLHFALYKDLDEKLILKAREIGSVIDTYLDVLGQDPQAFHFSVNRAIRFAGEHPMQRKIKDIEDLWLRTVDELNLKKDYIAFSTTGGRLLSDSKNMPEELLPLFLKHLSLPGNQDMAFTSISFKNKRVRVITLPFSYKNQERYIIQIASSLNPAVKILRNRLLYITASIIAIMFLSSFVGRVLTNRMLDPVIAIIKTAQNISQEDLSQRVKTENVDEEMKYLVDTFNEMIARLERSFSYIAEFSSNVSHEMKTPLAIIRGQTEVALRNEPSLEECKEVMRLNLEEVQRSLRIINDLLLLTKLDYQPDIYHFEEFDLLDFFNELHEQITMLASQKHIGVSAGLPQEHRTICADRLHLRRMFLDLADNAIKYTSEGGKISIDVQYKDGHTVISISDTGVGISEEDQEKIFDRFFRAGQGSGTGLGLSIVQAIATIHHGHIAVESRLDKGSTFTVTLPRA